MKTRIATIFTTLTFLTIAFIMIHISNAQQRVAPIAEPIADLPIVPPAPMPMPKLKITGNQGDSAVFLQTLDVQVEVSANVATTVFTMTFRNTSNRILEGELLFPLPEGVSVSSYALDIDGKMRQAVPVEKAKATQVFEEIVQRRVDPGLLERVEGNNYRTRIYPIPANGVRTVSIGYEQELNVENGKYFYHLPMDYKRAIDNFSLKATVWQSREKPKTEGALKGELIFDEQGTNFVATFSRKNFVADRSIDFSLPAPVDAPQVLMQAAEDSYYFTASCLPKLETRKKQWNDHLAVVWDASLSGRSRNFEKEFEVLDLIFKEKKNLTVSLFLLNNEFSSNGKYEIKNADWSALRKALEAVIYDGGTNFSKIDLKKISGNEILLFSDGLSTLSDAEIAKTTAAAVHTVCSSPKADYSALKWISLSTNGKFINLNSLTDNQLKQELFNETLQFLGVEKPASVREIYPSVATPVRGNFSVAGIVDAKQADITLLFGYGNTSSQRIKIKLDAKNAINQGNVYKIWAQKKLAELDLRYEKNKDEIREMGEQFGIVTRNTSLMVLETVQDYITYNITPPDELRAEYDRLKKGRQDENLRQQNDLLKNAVVSAKELKTWWGTDFKAKKPKYPKPEKNIQYTDVVAVEDVFEDVAAISDVAQEGSVDYAVFELREESPATYSEESVVELSEVASVGYATQRSRGNGRMRLGSSSMAESSAEVYNSMGNAIIRGEESAKTTNFQRSVQPKIKIEAPKQDKEYLKSLTGKVEEDYKTYFTLRENYLNTPDFYFDFSDWFYQKGDRAKALLVLTSIADIDIENASLFRLLGYRLKQYGEYALEEYVCRKVVEWRPIDPQSHRDYALAQADNDKKNDALKTLYSVLTQSFANNIASRSAGIEEVVVTEINHLISKIKNPDTSGIEPKILSKMPVDIRVVINWNMNSTDIDLHVTDPRGETCMYSHKQTEIGGRISRDITQGFGPEQFMLKNAMSGKYEVFVNYFGDSQVKPEGPSTIMAEIFTNYGTTNEKRQVLCLQLSKENKKEKNGLVKVAEFEF